MSSLTVDSCVRIQTFPVSFHDDLHGGHVTSEVDSIPTTQRLFRSNGIHKVLIVPLLLRIASNLLSSSCSDRCLQVRLLDSQFRLMVLAGR